MADDDIITHDDGRQVLRPHNAMADRMAAMAPDAEEQQVVLRQNMLDSIEAKREAQQSDPPVPGDKTPL